MCGLGAKNQRKYEFLKDPPHVWINGIPRGFVHVRGKAVPEAPLVSPLTQSPCCYHRTTIERVVIGDANKPGSYQKLSDEFRDRQFFVDDGTGSVLVQPRGATYEIPKMFSGEIEFGRAGSEEPFLALSIQQTTPPAEENLRSYLSQHGISETNGAMRKRLPGGGSTETYRLTEYCVLAGEEVSVFGTCAKYYGSGTATTNKIICKDEHLPVLAITSRNEFRVRPRLRIIAIASFSTGIVLIGLSLACGLLLIYPHFYK